MPKLWLNATELENIEENLPLSISIYIENPHNLAVMAYKSIIGTVLRNLISNAVKYSHAGGKIVVSAEQKQDELMDGSMEDKGSEFYFTIPMK